MRIPRALGFIAGSWFIGAAIFAFYRWEDFAVSSNLLSRAMEILHFIPFFLGLVVFGSVHQPSAFGFLVGMAVQWTLVGLIALSLYHGVRRIRAFKERQRLS